MPELAEIQADGPEPYLELVPPTKEVVLVRCPICDGLREISARRARLARPCRDCRSGRIVLRSEFYSFWLERFSDEEIAEMARAIWR